MSIELFILGSESATPTLNRNPSGQLLRMHDYDVLIDCGEGTQLQMLRFHQKFSRLKAVFISHMHGDHYLGLPGLLSSMHLMGRTAPLSIYGPVELEEIIRLQFSISQTVLRFPLEFFTGNTDKPRQLADFPGFTVWGFPLFHRIPCTGFLFKEKPHLHNIRTEALKQYRIPLDKINGIKEGKDYLTPEGILIPNRELTLERKRSISYAYCSDTSPDKSVIEAIRNADWLYHEATFGEELVKRARETFHSTAREAAETARDAAVKNLLIGHFSSRYPDAAFLLSQAAEVFPSTQAVYDGMQLTLD